MRDLLIEIIESNKAVRNIYVDKLSFNEIVSLMVSGTDTDDTEGSSVHNIKLSSDEELIQFEHHIKNKLLPVMDLSDVNSVLSQFVDTVLRAKSKKEIPPVATLILNLVVEGACSQNFWMRCRERETRYMLYHPWIIFFENVNKVIKYTKEDWLPLYAGELLEQYKDYARIEFWELSVSVEKIFPSIARKHVNFKKREVVRKSLDEGVQNAISYSEKELEEDWEIRESWYDEYKSVLDDCETFNELFAEDDVIEDVDQLAYLLDNYPPAEPDYDHDDLDRGGYGSSEDSRILDIFSDL
jgi:hypothetical protein